MLIERKSDVREALGTAQLHGQRYTEKLEVQTIHFSVFMSQNQET